MMAYLFLRGNAPDSLLMLQYGCPLSRVLLTDWLWQLFSAAGIFGTFPATVSTKALQRVPLVTVFQTT